MSTLSSETKVKNLRNRRYTISRGSTFRPFQFDGVVLAEAEIPKYRAAIYRTMGGKFVTEFLVIGTERSKAEVHGDIEAACAWFKPGTLTTKLLTILGRWNPEIIK